LREQEAEPHFSELENLKKMADAVATIQGEKYKKSPNSPRSSSLMDK
jgi:hypothetical protein